MKQTEKRAFKDQLYEQFARISKALANPHRLELLDVLAQCERTVEALAEETGLTVANASQHLQILRAAHLVEARREGVSMYYRLTAQELLSRLNDEQVVVLDVRPTEEYTVRHLPYARSLPVAELEARLAELPVDKEIVAYCRGPYCVFADEAVALLHARGYQARRLAEGLPDWKALGFPIEA